MYLNSTLCGFPKIVPNPSEGATRIYCYRGVSRLTLSQPSLDKYATPDKDCCISLRSLPPCKCDPYQYYGVFIRWHIFHQVAYIFHGRYACVPMCSLYMVQTLHMLLRNPKILYLKCMYCICVMCAWPIMICILYVCILHYMYETETPRR